MCRKGEVWKCPPDAPPALKRIMSSSYSSGVSHFPNSVCIHTNLCRSYVPSASTNPFFTSTLNKVLFSIFLTSKRSLTTSPFSTGLCNAPYPAVLHCVLNRLNNYHLGPALIELESDYNTQMLSKAPLAPHLWTRGTRRAGVLSHGTETFWAEEVFVMRAAVCIVGCLAGSLASQMMG